MTKSTKSKILATALCTAVMTGLYAAPAMAGDLQVFINSELKAYEPVAPGSHIGNVKGSFVIAGSDIANALQGENFTLGGLYVNGDTKITGQASVDGLFTVNNSMQVEGRANIKELSVAGGKLLVDSNGVRVKDGLTADYAFVKNLQVGGDKFTVNELGEVTAKGPANLKGGLTVTGDTTLEGLTAGATTVDSLAVTNNATVGGTLGVTGDTTVNGELTASGGLYVSKGATVNGVLRAEDGLKVTTGGIYVEQDGLTVVQGETELQDGLTVSGGATVDSLKTTNDKFVVNADGYTVIDNQLDVTGLANVGELTAGKAGITGDLQVTGNTTLAGLTAGATTVDSLTVTNNAAVGGTLTATGAAELKGGLKVTGGTETDELTVTGAAAVDSLKVAKDAEIGGNANVKGELSAANNKFSVDKDGDIFTAGGLTVKDGAMIGGGLSVTDGLAVTGGANITGNSTIAGNLAVTGGATVTGGFIANGGSTLSGGLTVSGETKLNNNLHVNGNTDIDGNLKVGTVADVEQSILDLEEYAGDLKDANLPGKVEGIDRDPIDGSKPAGEGVTTIEKATSFDKNGMYIKDAEDFGTSLGVAGMEITADGLSTKINAGGATFANAEGETVINGGAITADSLNLGSLDGREVGEVVKALEQKTAGIERDDATETTTIEGATSFDKDGMFIKDAEGFGTSLDVTGMEITAAGGLSTSFTAGGATFANAEGSTIINGGAITTKTINGVDFSKWHDEVDNRLDVLEDKTQNIKPGAGTGTGTGEGEGGAAGEGNNILPEVPDTSDGHTGINGDVTVGGEINAGQIVVGDKDGENQTTITDGSITTDKGDFGSEVTVGDNTTITDGKIEVVDKETGVGTTIDGGHIDANTGNIGGVEMEEGKITIGADKDTVIDRNGISTGNGNFSGNVDVEGNLNVDGKGTIGGVNMEDGTITTGNTTIDGDGITTDKITAGSGTIGDVELKGGTITAENGGTIGGAVFDKEGITVGNTEIGDGYIETGDINAENGNFSNKVTVGGEDGTTIEGGTITTGNTTIDGDGMTVGGGITEDEDGKLTGSQVTVGADDVDVEWVDKDGNRQQTSIRDNYEAINDLNDRVTTEVNRLDGRITKVEDRVDKVGAMSAAIANLRTMGYDPAAPTEIAVGIGQYRSETGLALGMFHYPNRDFMLSLSVSTSGEEVMGGIGATWKFGRKTPAQMLQQEQERAAKAKVEKAMAIKEAKVKAQQARHAKMAAEKAAQ